MWSEASSLGVINLLKGFSSLVFERIIFFIVGHPEYGQLGNHTDGKFLEKAGKVTFHFEYVPTKVVMYVEKDPKSKGITPITGVVIKEVTCGNNHTIAIDERNRAFSWGFGGYGRLGHSETKDEQVSNGLIPLTSFSKTKSVLEYEVNY